MTFASVAIPARVYSAFTYSVPSNMRVEAGMRVNVPFGGRKMVGICVGTSGTLDGSVEISKIKAIESVRDDVPVLSDSLVKLILWMSEYYCAPVGEVCRAALPTRIFQTKSPKTTRPCRPLEIEAAHEDIVKLTADQKNAFEKILAACGEGKYKTFLMHGVTGSGKTEVYFKIFEELRKNKKQGLLLVPEIGLTPQLTGRALHRFKDRVAVYHSGLTDAQRHKEWQKIKDGEIDVIVGTRSALFAPLPNLGAIVVDEEHDGSYKQDEGVTYNGRDSAIMRAHIENVPVILGSATPSIESMANAKSGKYEYIELTERPGGARLPHIQIVDMKKARRKKRDPKTHGEKICREFGVLTPELYDAISDTLARGEQALIYIGRRGFAGQFQCERCGKVISCPNCDIALTHHQRKTVTDSDVLLCHYCDYKIAAPDSCENCNGGALVPLGYGTQRLEAELADFFPKARIARFDSDTITNSTKRVKALDDMRKRKIDILVGTQMITKGHDFPNITLVGVVGVDAALNFPDFRSAEKTFQILTQVAGRAGRKDLPGKVIIQTMQPDHISFVSAQNNDINAFLKEEIEHRKDLFYPPFSRLANIKFSSNSEEKVEMAAKDVSDEIKKLLKNNGDKNIIILGPAPASIFKLRNKYRWQILIKASSTGLLSSFLKALQPRIDERVKSGVRSSIDVDPLNLL